ncbi:MAG: MFS transporter [Pseudomonadota bacterium]
MGAQRLSAARAWGYGIGDFGINLYFISAMTYLMYFYTDVFGLSAAAVATLFLVARVIDAVTDPLMGMIMDRTRSRWGRMRPYLLFGAPPMGLLLVLTFTVPDLSESGRLAWAYATYIAFGITFTIVGLPYSSLTARMTQDYDERTRLSTIRMACAFSGGLLVSVGTLQLVGLAADEATGFRNTMVFYAVVATALLWVTFAVARERIDETPLPARATGLDLRPILNNPPLWVVIGIFCCGMFGFTVRSAATPYYFKYYVGRPDLISPFFFATLSTMVVGLVSVPALADRLGKTQALYVGALVTLVGCVALYLMPPTSIVGIFVTGCVISLGATPVAVLGWALLPDTVEYAQWRHGVRADGLVYSVASFFQKLAKALAGAGAAAMLALAGYVANEAQSAASMAAIVGLMTWVPALILIPLVACAALHRLDEATHRRIVAELSDGLASPD